VGPFFLYKAVAFLGSFLAFALELWSAKSLLPRFGGSAAVWTTCVTFFSALLLAAYAGTGAALRRFGARRWSRAHFALLLVPFFLPPRFPAPPVAAGPMAALLWTLARGVAAPFLVLSTTTLVVQGWLMSAEGGAGRDAYSLYGASNLGAFAALVLYPLAIEPGLSLAAQARLGAALYALYAALHWPCRPRAARAEPVAEAAAPAAPRLRWLLLAAAPSAAMLATTNLLAFDFAAVPLLWVAPLAVYLLTLVLSFRRGAAESRSPLLPALGVWTLACAALAAFAVLRAGASTPAQTLRRLFDVARFGYASAALFAVGLLAHRALASERPASARAMTAFYAWLAAGGLLGTVAIAVLVPELGRGVGSLWLDWLVAGALAAAALAARNWDSLAGFARRRPGLAAALALAACGAGFAARHEAAAASGAEFSLRNFYGVYSVRDQDGARVFYHGDTDHGRQSLDPAKAAVPLTYYNDRSALAEAFAELGRDWRSIGVVGLGAGSIAAYGRPGQTIDFYELDPDVEAIARRWFTFLGLSRARVRVETGDARLALERADGASYDVLVLDAFNSGAVPVHLLTEEALALYLRRLSAGGVLLLHVSNRYLDLRPMLAASAQELGLSGASKRVVARVRANDDAAAASCWIALSRDPRKTGALIGTRGWRPLAESARGASPWTDQHASLLRVLAL